MRSYALTPTSEALFNAGFAYQNAGERVAAIETYRRFLAEPELDPKLARAAEDAISSLLRELGTLKGLRFDPDRPPAQLYVGGQRRELDELPLLLPPGPVEIEVVDEAGERGRETYELAAGESLVVDVRALLPTPILEPPPPLEPAPAPAPSPEPDADRQHRAKQLRTATWVGLGLTGAALGSYAALTVLAVREREAYLAATCFDQPGGECPADFVIGDPQGHFTRYNRLRVGAFVSVGVAGGLALGSLVVGLVSLRFEREATREQARVRVRPSLGGLAVEF